MDLISPGNRPRSVRDVLVLLAERGLDVAVIGPAGGGTGRAYEVEIQGRRRILKWQEPEEHGTPLPEVAHVLTMLHDKQYPVPGYEVLLDDPIEISVQEPLPGASTDALPDSVRDNLDQLIELQAGIGPLSKEDWGVRLQQVTLNGAPTWCRHDSLEKHSSCTRDLWHRARSMARTVDITAIRNGDVVHMDYHHRNILQRKSQVTGVVDWEGLECGDRGFDRFTLAFYSGVAGLANSRRRDWLADLTKGSCADAAALYIAHLAIRSVDWAIRNETESDVAQWLGWSNDAFELIA